MDQTTFPPDYQGNITITSMGCFTTNVKYMIFAYPQGVKDFLTLNIYTYSRVGAEPGASSPNTLTGQLNLLDSARGQTYPGQWILRVCAPTTPTKCLNDPTQFVGNTSFTVSGVPIPTPTPIPSNLPRASAFPSQCTYQIGSPIKIFLENLQPNTKYEWWWYGESPFPRNLFDSDSSNSSLFLEIPFEKTKQIPTRTFFCVDLASEAKFLSSSRCLPGSQNSVGLEFIAGPPPTDGSACITTSTGAQTAQNIPTPTPIAPPPPCSQWADLSGTPIPTDSPNIQNADYPKKCASVSTGLGINVSTDAGDLVKSVFGVILSISGGIALILIIISGYSLIFSQGNPEAVKAAQERLTSAVVGLLFIIFSLVILQIIGADILKIPGFSK